MEKLSRNLDRPIVLVGLMGAGKSTVGRRLAKRLGLDFIDSDKAIEEAAGATTAEIFERHGEDAFRDGERRVIARLIDGSIRVIATGGGAFNDPRTRSLLNAEAVTVWLDAPVEVLAERTKRRDNRPLLKNGDRHVILTRLAEERKAFYAQAHIHIRIEREGSHGEVVEAIVTAVDDHLG